jgi:hypothetical protein
LAVLRLGSASPSIVHCKSPAKPEGLECEPAVSRSNTGHALRLGSASPSIVHCKSPAKPEGLEGVTARLSLTLQVLQKPTTLFAENIDERESVGEDADRWHYFFKGGVAGSKDKEELDLMTILVSDTADKTR